MVSLKASLAARKRSAEKSLRKTFIFYGLDPSSGLNGLCKKLLNFRLVALGDSVTWGQGLLDAEKTFNIVGAFIKASYPELKVIIENFSHSGAIIGSETQRFLETPSIWGEIPEDLPTILRQLDSSTPEIDHHTDLVLLNGGMNDINFRTIINPFGGDLEPLCKKNCYNKIKILLLAVHQKYPNALIWLTGYYKIFSSESNRLLIPLFLLTFDILPPIEKMILVQAVISRCETFFTLSEQLFNKSVAEINPIIDYKATYVENNWKDSNSIFAANPFLFGINADLSPQDHPDIIRRRKAECSDSKFQCHRASAGHPNVNGAKNNAEQLIKLIRTNTFI